MIKERVVDGLAEKDKLILDLGCGTGDFALGCARKGAQVVGIDNSSRMLEVAHKRIEQEDAKDKIKLKEMDILDLEMEFEREKFDLITAWFVFSELERYKLSFVLKGCWKLLKKGGTFVLLDETLPSDYLYRFIFLLLRAPVALLTLILARSITHPLKDFEAKLRDVGLKVIEVKQYSSTLTLFAARKG